MKFAKVIFTVAGIYGLLVITPLFFIFDLIGKNDPPPITHPGFYYGFTCVTFAWQIAFLVIGRDPVRFRPMMIPAILEKIPYFIAASLLYSHAQIKAPDFGLACIDLTLGILFFVAFIKTGKIADNWNKKSAVA